MKRTPSSKKTGRKAERDPLAGDAATIVNDLRRLFRAIHEYSKAIQRAVGFSGPQVWALTVIQDTPGISLGDLSDRLFAHPSTVSGVVDRLVERGVVLREVNADDRRGIRLTLTDVGREMVARSPSPVQVGLRRALEQMPEAQLAALRRSLDEIVAKTEAYRFEAPFFDIDE
jgi:DNA-binding MarR family transcriptional regulator